jgi:2-keto-3-deoxy-L-rhamnonate aldolase RhmA
MRILANAGYDFVFIDISHSSFSLETVGDMCDLARASGVVPIVRPYDTTTGLAGRLLDMGAMGLIYPHVEKASEIARLHGAMKYEPVGYRGATGRGGANTDYTSSGELSQTSVREFANENTLLAIQIEDRESVERLDEILDGKSVDVVEVGRSDLSASYGVPSDIRNPLVLAALDKVIEACDRYGAAPGAGCYSVEDATDMVSRGMRWLTYSSDRRILASAYGEGYRLLAGLVQQSQEKKGGSVAAQ